MTVAQNVSHLEVVNKEWVRVVLSTPANETTTKVSNFFLSNVFLWAYFDELQKQMFRFFWLFQQPIHFLFGSLKSLESKLEKMQQFHNIDHEAYLDVIYKVEFTSGMTPLYIIISLFTTMVVSEIVIEVLGPITSHTKSIAKCIDPDNTTVRFK